MSDASTSLQYGGEGAASALTAERLAQLVGGTIVGDGATVVHAVAPLDRAGPDEISFLTGPRYAPLMASTRAAIVLVPPDLADVGASVRARIVVERPHDALVTLLPLLHAPAPRVPGVHATAVIGRGARIGDGAAIGPYVVIGAGATIGERCSIGAHCFLGDDVTVGDDALLHPSVTLYRGARVGRRVTLHSGVRIASDGFGYVFRGGAHEKIPHVGRAIIDDDVEIGANTTVDRGSIDDTRIGAGTKIDNLVHVGHNVRIGRLCLIMAQVGIAGSARIDDGVIIAGQAGLGGHIHIGSQAKIGGQAGVFGDVPAGESWSGYPARPHRAALRAQAAVLKLPGLMRALERLVAERGA